MSIWFTVIIQSQREPLSVEAWYWHWYLVVRNWINFLFILYLKRSGARVIHLSIFFSSLSGDYFVLPSRSAVTTHQQMGVLLVRQMMEKMVVGIQGHAVLCSPSSPHFVLFFDWVFNLIWVAPFQGFGPCFVLRGAVMIFHLLYSLIGMRLYTYVNLAGEDTSKTDCAMGSG